MVDFAELTCVLKVNSRCNACNMQTMEVMRSIIGAYSLTMDAGLVRISGEVEPDRALNALAKCGKHAEVVWSRLGHPQLNINRHNHMHNTYNYNHIFGNYNYNPGYNLGYGNYYGALEDTCPSNYTYGNMQVRGGGYRPFYNPAERSDSYLPYYH